MSLTSGAADPTRDHVNVLFINADQLRWDALSCMASSVVETPNLDRLAREGVRFTRAYTPSPVCVPARTSWQLGLYPATTNSTSSPRVVDEGINFGSGSFDQNLSRIGYRAEYHGRYHAPPGMLDCYQNEVTPNILEPYRAYLREQLGEPPPPAEGQIAGFLSGWPYTPDPADYELRVSCDDTPGHDCYGVEYGIYELPAHHSYTAYCATRTIDALDRLWGEPFIITTGILHPHHPQYVPRPYAGSVDPGEVPLPKTMHDERIDTPFAGSRWQVDPTEIANMQLIGARYHELVREVDDHVGRILDTLDASGLVDDTLVIFCSDHGEMLGDHGLTQKFVPYEESVRVPLLMRLPGRIEAGRVVDAPVNLVDMYPTIFDFVGHPCPPQEGRSLKPLIDGDATDRPDGTFVEMYTSDDPFASSPDYTMLVSRDRKLAWTHDPRTPNWMVDLRNDPDEMTNLLGDNPDKARYLPQAEDMKQAMLNWMDSIDHRLRDKLRRQEL